MLKNIKPNRKRSKAGSLTEEEKKYSKSLFAQDYVVQDIAYIINQGRAKTVNQSVIQLCKNDINIVTVSDKNLDHFIEIQSSYDPLTLLNPYKDARLIRARETMMAAVQIFNNPSLNFKTEMFCVFANIAWTYLIHEKMEKSKKGSTILGNGNSITVSGTLDKKICPIKNAAVIENLKQIIKIRDAVEHTFFVGGEDCFGHLFQACCINFEKHMIEWFGNHLSMAKQLSLALQFVRLNKQQIVQIETTNFPAKIKTILTEIQASSYSDSNAFQLNVHFSSVVTSKTNADLHKLVDYGKEATSSEIVIKLKDMIVLSQKQVVEKVVKKGYSKFNKKAHQLFWQKKWPTAKIRNKKASEFGKIALNLQWLWFEKTWLSVVLKYCESNSDQFK